MSTPRKLGYWMPAEWEKHRATWVAWPHNRDTWPGNFDPIPGVFKQFVETLAESEPVHVLAGGKDVLKQAQQMVGHLPNVTLHDIPTNDAWTRDHGPTFLVASGNQQPALVHWRYNAWGGKYPPFDLDADVPRRIAEATGRKRFVADVVLEGGAIDTDGQGTFLASETCLLNSNRNPGLSRQDMEWYLREYLGAKKVLWIAGTIAGDDTDGHVDQIARFVAPGKVIVATETNATDENYACLQEVRRQLNGATDAQGRKLELIELPMPEPLFYQGQRLPASYANFYICNRFVIVPAFGVSYDERAAEILQACFPDRKVRLLAARDLIWGLGAYHCLTQQEPEFPGGSVSQ